MKQYTDKQKRQINEIDIITETGEPAAYEQLAEEATELAKAALKCARVIRKESYTPKTIEECKDELKEEFSDVICCANTLKLQYSEEIVNYKTFRWKQRIFEYQKKRVKGDGKVF